MDHEHYDWSPIVKRGVLRWPGDARVALGVIVNLEHVEWKVPEGGYQVQNLSGGVGPLPFPNYIGVSHREYGHRVGIFRVLKVLAKHGINATIAMDSLTAQHYPYLVSYCKERQCEFIGHGISMSRMITSQMSEQQERRYIRESIDALESATGTPPAGWLGPEYGESTRTPQLLAEAGLRYVCDWTNDEQPYPMKSARGEIYALPIMLELDDVNALWDRRVTIGRYRDMLTEAFDAIYEDSTQSGRLLVLNLHPWLIGQPFRIRYLDDALGHMVRRQGVWAATGAEIVDWYRTHTPAG
jgi:peptidoglycan/xylan/chitin deacetylase (PgdA/CDA1 family)